jgi:hypothetical protein
MNIPYDKLPPVPAGHTVIGPLSDPFFPQDRSRVPEAGMLAEISVPGDRWETGRWCFDGSSRLYLALPDDHEMVKRWCEEKGTRHPVSKKWRTRDGRPVIILTECGPCPHYPIVGATLEPSGKWENCTWTAGGEYISDHPTECASDLIPILATVIHVDPATNTILDEATGTSVRYTLSND